MKNFLLLLLLTYFANANIDFKVDYPQTEKISANSEIEMMITAEWVQGDETYLIFKPSLPGILGLSISEHISFGETLTSNSQTLQRIIHLYKFSITNNPGELVESGNIFVDYRNAKHEEIQHKQLAGFSFEVDSSDHNILTISVSIILVLVIFFVIISRKKNFFNKKTQKYSGLIIETEFLKKLNEIKRLSLEGNLSLYFQELEILLREYFRQKYNIGSLEDWKTNSNSSTGPDKKTLIVIMDLLKLCRDVRYAGTIPNTYDQKRTFNFLKNLFTKNLPRQALKNDELYLKND